MHLLKPIKTKSRQIVSIALLCFFLFSESFAQDIAIRRSLHGTIDGVVVDSSTQARLSHVTVELQESEKDNAKRSTLTDENGLFVFTSLSAQKQYQLTLTYAGYRTVRLQVPSLGTSPIHLGPIVLVSLARELQEIQVTVPRPILEQNPDKLIYHADADPESKTASALDILRKIPLLSVDAEDNLLLNGLSNYQVLINGRSSSLFVRNQADLFRNLPASAIKTIEVITVPPSRYEASGVGGIINITTYKKSIGGYNGGISVRASHPSEQAANGQLALKAGKFSLSTSFSHTTNNTPANTNSFTRIDKSGQSRLEQTGSGQTDQRAQNGGAELSYELNEHTIISLGYSTNRDDDTYTHTEKATLINQMNGPPVVYRRQSDNRNKQHGNDLHIDYQRNFKKNEERQLTFSYRRSYSKSRNDGYFTLQPLPGQTIPASITNNTDLFLEHTGQADYVQPLKKHTLELGLSVLQRQNNSNYFYKDQDTTTGAFLLDSSQSNSFMYGEDIYAGYASLNLKMGKWGLKSGTRLEMAKIDARFTSSGGAVRQEYVNLIPYITLFRQLKGISSLRLSYTQRIQRPDLNYLDPYVDRTDPWNISYGNPGLQPALAHVFSLGYSILVKKTSINLNIFHQSTNNSIQQFTVLYSDTVSRTTFGNIGQSRNTSFTLGMNTTLFKKLGINLHGNANYQEYSSFINGKPHNNKGFTYGVSGSTTLKLKTWRLGTNISYNAPNVLLQGRTAGYTANNATLNKYFLKNNQANIALSVSSLFREHRRSFTEIDDPAFYLWRESLSVIRRYNLSFNYRFAKVQGSGDGKREK